MDGSDASTSLPAAYCDADEGFGLNSKSFAFSMIGTLCGVGGLMMRGVLTDEGMSFSSTVMTLSATSTFCPSVECLMFWMELLNVDDFSGMSTGFWVIHSLVSPVLY